MSEFIDLGERFFIILHPRPVFLMVTMGKDSRVNVMALSWHTPISEDEQVIGVTIDKGHFTRKLLDEIPEFTLNLPTIDLINEVWKAGTISGHRVDKTKVLKLTFSKARKVKPPIINECIAHLECIVDKILSIGEVDFIIAKVVAAYAKQEFLYKGSWDIRKAKILQHLTGKAFTYNEKVIFPQVEL